MYICMYICIGVYMNVCVCVSVDTHTQYIHTHSFQVLSRQNNGQGELRHGNPGSDYK